MPAMLEDSLMSGCFIQVVVYEFLHEREALLLLRFYCIRFCMVYCMKHFDCCAMIHCGYTPPTHKAQPYLAIGPMPWIDVY